MYVVMKKVKDSFIHSQLFSNLDCYFGAVNLSSVQLFSTIIAFRIIGLEAHEDIS